MTARLLPLLLLGFTAASLTSLVSGYVYVCIYIAATLRAHTCLTYAYFVRGYIVTAPNKFVPGREENVCISLHDLPSDNPVSVTFNLSTHKPPNSWQQSDPELENKPLSDVTFNLDPTTGRHIVRAYCQFMCSLLIVVNFICYSHVLQKHISVSGYQLHLS